MMASEGVNFDRQRYISNMLREGKEMGMSDTLLSDLRTALETIAPITAGNQARLSEEGFPGIPLDRDSAVLRGTGLMLPISKGATKSTLIAAMAEAIRAGDQQKVDDIINSLLGTRHTSDLREMIEAAREKATEFPTPGEPEPRAKPNQYRKRWFN
jgi:hypothetical protein